MRFRHNIGGDPGEFTIRRVYNRQKKKKYLYIK